MPPGPHTDEKTAALAVAIGSRVRQERLQRQITLDDLSLAAGVSRRMLVNVEKGAVNPSVGTLLKLSDALGVGLPALVEPPRQEELHIVRDGDGATLWTSTLGGRGVLLAGTSPPDVVELWDWVFQPGDQCASEAHTRGTRELLHVQEGAIEIVIGDQAVTLSAGDAASFLADVDHTYANHGEVPARFTLAVFEPGVGTASRFDDSDKDSQSGDRP